MKGKIVLISLAFLCILPHSLFAYGFGAYGKASVELCDFGIHGREPLLTDTTSGNGKKLMANYTTGFGIVFDTAVARKERFNYRASLSYESTIAPGNKFFKSFSMNRIMLINTFGFSLLSNNYFRLWMGPQLALGYKFYRYNRRGFDQHITIEIIEYTNTKIDLGMANIGGVLGINANLGSTFTLFFETGIRFGMITGNYNDTDMMVIRPSTTPLPLDLSKKSDVGSGNLEIFIQIGFMFRIKDKYSPNEKSSIDMKT